MVCHLWWSWTPLTTHQRSICGRSLCKSSRSQVQSCPRRLKQHWYKLHMVVLQVQKLTAWEALLFPSHLFPGGILGVSQVTVITANREVIQVWAIFELFFQILDIIIIIQVAISREYFQVESSNLGIWNSNYLIYYYKCIERPKWIYT